MSSSSTSRKKSKRDSMEFPSRSLLEICDSRLPPGQEAYFDCYKLTAAEKESLCQEVLFEGEKNPDILLNAKSTGPTAKAAGDLQKEVKIEEESDVNTSTLNAPDFLNEPAGKEETFGYYRFPEEGRKPFDEDNLFEDVKDPSILLAADSTDSFAPTFEDLQSEVKIEDDSDDGGCRRGVMLNAADLLDSDEDQPLGRLLFTCLFVDCPFSFNTFEELEEHMGIHRETQVFACDVCTLRFFSKDDAMVHIRQREKKECCECGKRFEDVFRLAEHLRCHDSEWRRTEEKPSFSCSVCKKSFATSTTLKVHKRTHTGEKPYKCSHCGHRFTQKSNMKAHIRIHTGQKPYSCEKCDAKFSRSDLLKRHLKKNHQS